MYYYTDSSYKITQVALPTINSDTLDTTLSSIMVSVSEALRKWDQLAPSVLDIYYEFMYNYVTILIDVWMSGIEINFFKIKKNKKYTFWSMSI